MMRNSLIAMVLLMGVLAGQASAVTINVDFSRAWYGVGNNYVSPAGIQTAGYWNSSTTGLQLLRDKTVAFSGVLGNFQVPLGGNSFFGGADSSNPNIVLGDAFGARGFHYTMTGLSDGQYDLFLYARSNTETFTDMGIDLVPVSLTNLVGDVFTYVYSVDVSGGILDLEAKAAITWIAGLQITNDPAPSPVPSPGITLLLIAGLAAIGFIRKRKACYLT